MAGPVVVLVAACLVVATGILGWLGKLPRNRLAGVRTSATLRSDEAWVVANRVAGPMITVGGIASMVGSVVAMFVPSPEVEGTVLVAVLVMAVLVLVGAVQGVRAAREVDN